MPRWDHLSSNLGDRDNRIAGRKHEKAEVDAMICPYRNECEVYVKYSDEYCGSVICRHYDDYRVRGIESILHKEILIRLPDIEKVAKSVHRHWVSTRLERQLFSCIADDGEELMVPYEQLSEKQKEKDRRFVRAVYSAIQEELQCQK